MLFFAFIAHKCLMISLILKLKLKLGIAAKAKVCRIFFISFRFQSHKVSLIHFMKT